MTVPVTAFSNDWRVGVALGARVKLVAEARHSFGNFVEQMWPALEPNGRPLIRNRGTDAIIDHLQAMGDGQIRRLLIACPPGFGKSTLATVAWPLWMWVRNPSWRVICASYAHALAHQLAIRAQRVLQYERFKRFDIELAGEAVDTMETTAGGRRYAVGVNGALTGFRADGFVVDDSLNAVDAHSDNAIRSVNDWFDAALSNRLDRGEFAPKLVIQQRLDEMDLIGHLAAKGGWEQLILTAEFESSRPCVTSIWKDDRTVDGEMLAPAIQSQAYLDEQRKDLGPYGYAAQYPAASSTAGRRDAQGRVVQAIHPDRADGERPTRRRLDHDQR
jgi:hypothetical protein